MGILSKPEITTLWRKQELVIQSIDSEQPFNADAQITEDGLDLRLGITGLRFKKGIGKLDSLFESDIHDCFERVDIPLDGYSLEPGQVLFTSTLEVICLSTSKYVGSVFGRSTFARFGLSVHCTQPLFPAGVAWSFPLQIVNHNTFPIIIYPYMYIAQLQLQTTVGDAVSYNGKYDKDITVRPPKITPRELEPLKKSRTGIHLLSEVMSAARVDEIRLGVRRFEERESSRERVSEKGYFRYVVISISGILAAFFLSLFGNFIASTGATSEGNHFRLICAVLSVLLGLLFLIFTVARAKS